ncbi:MAG: PQQ-binding-like beta-propeller repeat protein, partial [Gammaproteobacteria bacterium]
ITPGNVASLGLAWQADLDSNRGLEGTPIVVDGVMYVSATWSRVTALDARNGTVLWKFDPQIPHTVARKGCCDAVNRGVAVAKGRVFLGSYDGRLACASSTRSLRTPSQATGMPAERGGPRRRTPVYYSRARDRARHPHTNKQSRRSST